MRLPNLTDGKISLTNVEYYPRLSEETLAFNAKLKVGNIVCEVASEGRGGPPMIHSREAVKLMLDLYRTEGSAYPMLDVESAIFTLVCKAADDLEEKKLLLKRAKQGYAYSVPIGHSIVFFQKCPSTDFIVEKYGEAHRDARVTFTEVPPKK